MSDDHFPAVAKKIPIELIRPNPWNPQRMDQETFEKEKRSIRDHGFIMPIVVRTKDDGKVFEIIDGEHRFKALVELGYAKVFAMDLGSVPDHQAKALTLKLNDIRGAADEDLKSNLMKDLFGVFSFPELMETLPYDPEYYTQFPEFLSWTDAPKAMEPTVLTPPEALEVSMPARGKYEGFTMIHALVPTDRVKELKKWVKENSREGETLEVTLGGVLISAINFQGAESRDLR